MIKMEKQKNKGKCRICGREVEYEISNLCKSCGQAYIEGVNHGQRKGQYHKLNMGEEEKTKK